MQRVSGCANTTLSFTYKIVQEFQCVSPNIHPPTLMKPGARTSKAPVRNPCGQRELRLVDLRAASLNRVRPTDKGPVRSSVDLHPFSPRLQLWLFAVLSSHPWLTCPVCADVCALGMRSPASFVVTLRPSKEGAGGLTSCRDRRSQSSVHDCYVELRSAHSGCRLRWAA